MTQRKSLVDDSLDSIGRKGSSGGKANNADKIKLGVAIGALVLASLLFAWNFGFLGGSEPVVSTPPISPERQKVYEKKKKQIEQSIEEEEGQYGGA